MKYEYGAIHLLPNGSLHITAHERESHALYSSRAGALIVTDDLDKGPYLLSISHHDLIEALIKMAEERGISIDGK